MAGSEEPRLFCSSFAQFEKPIVLVGVAGGQWVCACARTAAMISHKAAAPPTCVFNSDAPSVNVRALVRALWCLPCR